MSSKIILRELTLSCAIGIDAAEQQVRQQVVLDVDMLLVAAPLPDAATPAVCYHGAVAALRALAAEQRFGLLETFAEHAAAVLLEHEGVAEVRVSCCKPKIFADTGAAGVEIVRKK